MQGGFGSNKSVGVGVAAVMQWKHRQSNAALGKVQLCVPLAVSMSSRGIVNWIQRCSNTRCVRYTASDHCQWETGVDSSPRTSVTCIHQERPSLTKVLTVTRMQDCKRFPCIYSQVPTGTALT